MTLKEVETLIKDVWGKDTQVFAREDFISGNKKVLRPINEGADVPAGRRLEAEKLEILGQGKTWEDACRMAVAPEMLRRQTAARLRAAYAEHEGEMFSLFLRARLDAEFQAWRTTDPLALQHQAAFEARIKPEAAQDEKPNASA